MGKQNNQRPVGTRIYQTNGRGIEWYVNKVDEYLKINKDRTVKILKSVNQTKVKTYDNKLKVKLPTLHGYALFVGVTKVTIDNWVEDEPTLRDAVDKIRHEQRQRLINMGLSGEYNSTIAKLMLSSNHGMVEITDSTTKGDKLNIFNDEQITRIANRLNGRKVNDGDTSGTKQSD